MNYVPWCIPMAKFVKLSRIGPNDLDLSDVKDIGLFHFIVAVHCNIAVK